MTHRAESVVYHEKALEEVPETPLCVFVTDVGHGQHWPTSPGPCFPGISISGQSRASAQLRGNKDFVVEES